MRAAPPISGLAPPATGPYVKPMNAKVIVCPVCDAMLHVAPADIHRPARCPRCGDRLVVGEARAVATVVGLALTALALMVIVLFMPFLEMERGPFGSKASVFDTVMSLSQGVMVPLSLAVLAFIIVLPLARLFLLSYALIPVLIRRPNWPGAARALRWAFYLKPWAMAEIFMVGVTVAMVKLAGMAQLHMGPAFWAFVVVVLLTAYKDTFMCRHTLWHALISNR